MHPSAAKIVGLGAVTCAGRGVATFWEACSAARPGLSARALPDGLDDARYCAFAEPRTARQSLETAISEAVTSGGAALAPFARPRVALFAGSSLGGMAGYEALHRVWWRGTKRDPLPHQSARYEGPAQEVGAALLERLGRSVGTWSINTACSSAANALGMARNWLIRRRIDVAVVAGYDVISPFVYAGFASLNAIDREPTTPFSQGRAGLNLGEAAVAFVLTRADDVEGPGVGVTGFGSSCDAHHLTRPDLSGAGLVRAVRSALADAGVAAHAIQMVSAHGTGTSFNDQMESAALGEIFGECPPLHCAKPVVGHTLGAAGAVDALLCVEALRHRLVPATFRRLPPDPALPIQPTMASVSLPKGAIALSTSSGFGGSNAALVFAELAA